MGKDGSHAGRQQEKRQTKEILGFAHPIQINLFEEIHAHSDPLELDTNHHRFVPEIKLFPIEHLCSAGFSLWGFILERNKTHRLKARATKYSTPPRGASWPGASQR